MESWDQRIHRREREANSFAAAILIPKASITPFLLRDPEATDIADIAQKHQASLTASAFRFVELSSYRLAIVWSQNGTVVWYKPSDEFGRAVKKEIIDPESVAHRCYTENLKPDDFDIVPATAWLYSKYLKEHATILEYSVPMPFYGGVLTLLHISSVIEDWTEWSDDYADEMSAEDFTLRRSRWPR